MDQLIYESKGGSKQAQTIVLVGCIILIVCGVFIWVLSAYLLSGKVRRTFTFIGIGACIFAALFIYYGYGSKKNSFRIFENHVESVSYVGATQHEFNLAFHEIENIQITRTTFGFTIVSLQTKHRTHYISLDHNAGEEVFRLIKERTK